MSLLQPRSSGWFRGIQPGDTVTYADRHGNQKKGRAVICSVTHVTINAGGRHGTPQVVDEKNYIKHRARPTKS